MKRLVLIFAVACIAATLWGSASLRSAEADYVQAQRGPK